MSIHQVLLNWDNEYKEKENFPKVNGNFILIGATRRKILNKIDDDDDERKKERIKQS